MAIKVLIPSVLRPFVENQQAVTIEAGTVDELLEKLLSRYETLRHQVLSEEGGLRGFINVYVNDKDIRYLDKYKTRLEEGDIVTIVPAISGGA